MNKENISENPVIFVPGIKGSELTDAAGEKVWFKISKVFANSSPLIYKENDGIVATGIVGGFKLLPYILEYQPYSRINRELSNIKNGYLFYYDWRDYPDTNSKKFGELVERVIRETGKKPSVVAHSMGGLIAHGYIKEHPESIYKVVYVSVPFQPGVGYFDDINEGSPVGLNSTILSKEAVFSHPASYLLLPHKGSNRYEGKELMDAKTWSDNKFSIFKDSTTDLVQFQKMLDRIAEYHRLLDTPKTLNNQFLLVVGECYKTVLKIDKDGKRIYVAGDNRVSEQSSYPLDILTNMSKSAFCVKHDRQMNDKKIINKIFEFLNAS